jgi:ribosomal protein L11 methyltransferase
MTTELRLPGLGRHRVERVSAALFALGALGVQEDWLPGEAPAPLQPWDEGPPPKEPDRVVLIAWFEDPDRAGIERTLRPLAGPVLPAWSTVAEVDWEESWKSTFPPIVVSPRLTVAPPWDAPEGALVIDPGQGFGTGHHTTTRQALRALDALLAPGHGLRTALDVGCGSGILALAAARLGLEVSGVDVEEAAVREAAANAARNGLVARFGTERVADLVAPADLVLANLHAELLRDLAPDLIRLTGQRLVVAGVLVDREELVHAALGRELAVADRAEEDGWVCLGWRKRT